MHDYTAYRTEDFNSALERTGFHLLDLLVCGATGVGKSSTPNALFAADVVRTAGGAAFCTRDITHGTLNEYLRIRDTPTAAMARRKTRALPQPSRSVCR